MKFSRSEPEAFGFAEVQVGSFALKSPATIVGYGELNRLLMRLMSSILLGEL